MSCPEKSWRADSTTVHFPPSPPPLITLYHVMFCLNANSVINSDNNHTELYCRLPIAACRRRFYLPVFVTDRFLFCFSLDAENQRLSFIVSQQQTGQQNAHSAQPEEVELLREQVRNAL